MKFITMVLSRLPIKWARSLRWIRNRKYFLPLRNPQTYDEKINWLIINYWDRNISYYADKYLVRDYVKECGCENILIRLLGAYDKTDEIDFGSLPSQFVLKTNHGTGNVCYEICYDKNGFDVQNAIKKMNDALKLDLWRVSLEPHYRYINRKIICEELLTQEGKACLDDYKVVCSYGIAKYILVCSERDQGRDYYDTEWNYCDFVIKKYRSGHLKERPEKLDELLKYAEILSKPFPLARVDFYIVNNKIYFGEITFTPSGGYHNYLNEKGQIELGKTIALPERKKRNRVKYSAN